MQVIIRCKGRYFCPEDVPGDGNCYFRSLCKDPFFSSQNYDHRSLRRELYNRIDSNTELKNKLSRFFVHYTTVDNLSDFDEYLNAMKNYKFWAGGLESMMIFFVFNVNVICLQAARQHPSEDAIIPHKFDFIDYSTNIEYLGLVTNEELLVLKSKEVKEIWLCYHYAGDPLHASTRPTPDRLPNHYLYMKPVEEMIQLIIIMIATIVAHLLVLLNLSQKENHPLLKWKKLKMMKMK